jgi:hypothetical protein
LLDRAGADPSDLIRRQREALAPSRRRPRSSALFAWRRATAAAAAIEFLDGLFSDWS